MTMTGLLVLCIRVLTFTALGVILFFTFIHLGESASPGIGWDKLLHVLAYLTLAGLAGLGWSAHPPVVPIMGLATVAELAHLALPWREFALLDLTANLFGAAAGLLLARWILSRL